MLRALLFVALGTGFTFFMTSLGSAMVFFFKKKVSQIMQRMFLGFAAGVMIAASVWSLLIPAIEEAEHLGWIPYVPAAGGFVIGGVFFLLLDSFLPHLHPGSDEPEGIKTIPCGASCLYPFLALASICPFLIPANGS